MSFRNAARPYWNAENYRGRRRRKKRLKSTGDTQKRNPAVKESYSVHGGGIVFVRVDHPGLQTPLQFLLKTFDNDNNYLALVNEVLVRCHVCIASLDERPVFREQQSWWRHIHCTGQSGMQNMNKNIPQPCDERRLVRPRIPAELRHKH
jgi:hypothetical protein